MVARAIISGRDLARLTHQFRGMRGGMRVGLVLGAGGVVGASWLIGALEALEAETGWKGAEAERIVGTSAGSVIGALTAAGVAPELMGAYAVGRVARRRTPRPRRARRRPRASATPASEYRLTRALPPHRPRLVAPDRRHPAPPAPAQPGRDARGLAAARLRLHRPDPATWSRASSTTTWPAHPSYWAVAADYATGRRAAFGSDGRAAGARRRGRRRLVRDPRLLPPASRSPAGATSTAASARTRTSTCSPARGSTSSSA